MLRQPATRLGAVVALLAAGLACALTLGPTARAYTITQLPNMGFGIIMDYLPQNGCHAYKVGWRNDPKTDLGSDCDPGFQDRLNAFMAANCPPRVCPENAPTTATVTTTQTTTNTETDVLTLPAEQVTTTLAVPVPLIPTADNDQTPPADVDPVQPAPPVASFAVINDNGLTISVSDLKGNSNVVWMFGDGANGSGNEATHRYAEPGRYTIIEEVVDASGLAAQTTETVTVARPTTARANAIR